MIVEGVTYYPFRIRFTLSNGKRRVIVRWSPGRPWIPGEIAREFHDRGIDVKRGSNVYISEVSK